MTDERFDRIMWHETEELTADDVASGWHFCLELDGLLINANDPGHDFCHCIESDEPDLQSQN